VKYGDSHLFSPARISPNGRSRAKKGDCPRISSCFRGAFLAFPLALFLLPAGCGRRKLSSDELERNRLFAEILKREDRRTLGEDDFFPRNLHFSTHPEVRQWCAVALGRIGNRRALPWLYNALHSSYASVRAAAAFAVGEIEDRETLKEEFLRVDPRAASELVAALDDPSIQVRMRAVEALGKAGSPSDSVEIIRRLHALPYEGSPVEQTYLRLAITALTRLRDPSAVPALEKLAESPDPEIQWRCANGLYGLRARKARSTFLRLLRSYNPDVRAHAARGAGICEAPDLADALIPLISLHDPDSGKPNSLGVRASAVEALGNLRNPGAIPAIRKALQEAPIVRANPEQVNFAVQAAAALGNIGAPEGKDALVPLTRIQGPAAVSAVIALAKLSRGNATFFDLVRLEDFTTEAARRAAAQALGEVGGPEAVRRLKLMLIQAASERATAAEIRAVPAAVEALARIGVEDLQTIVEPYLASHDGVILRAAIKAYKPPPRRKAPWKPLVEAYQRMAPGWDLEAKVSALSALQPWLSEQDVQAVLRSALGDRQRNARVAALSLLRKAGATDVPADPGPSESATTDITYSILAVSRQNRTVATLETERGNIEIELYREDAPLTTANFISLARGDFFNGLSFMRVVPYYVIQGGDPRNDMEGGPGYTIRCEINMRAYEKGSVGMALSGKDTGGSQFFITLSPQPRLDGGFTCFGRVISGMQAAQSMTAGDKILKVRIEEDHTLFDYRRY